MQVGQSLVKPILRISAGLPRDLPTPVREEMTANILSEWLETFEDIDLIVKRVCQELLEAPLQDRAMVYADRTCSVCGHLFTPRQSHYRTCSPQCSKAWPALLSQLNTSTRICRWTGCKNSSDPSYRSACPEHIENMRERLRNKNNRTKESGNCTQCGKQRDGNSLVCLGCKQRGSILSINRTRHKIAHTEGKKR